MDTWEIVHNMSEAQLAEFAAEHRVEMRRQFDHLRAAADFVCAELQIAPPPAHQGEDLDRLALAYMNEHRCSYTMALDAVCRRHPDVAQAYTESFGLDKAPIRT